MERLADGSTRERMRRILVVDEDAGDRRALSALLAKASYRVRAVSSLEEALEQLRLDDFGVILAGLPLGHGDSLEPLHALQEAACDAYLIPLLPRASQELAMPALLEGAWDYLTRPLTGDAVLSLLNRLEARDELFSDRGGETERSPALLTELVGQSESMQRVVSLARKFAPYKTPVLIMGESGTGKELLARAIHRASERSGALVSVNCASFPESLLESELFGHVKGAFTGAVRNRKGLVEEAHQGTLFLDEIGEMPLPFQTRLLRLLESEEVRPVGDSRTVSVDVRFVCATSCELARAVSEGRFREDLFYRINVLTLKLPPLRERRDDILSLVEHFLTRFRRQLRRDVKGVRPQAMRRLLDHDWPGNVRELEHVLERGVILASDGWVDLDGLPPELQQRGTEGFLTGEDLSIKRATRTLERTLILRALQKTRGNRTKASLLLEISHRALLYKIKEYGIRELEEG